MIQLSWDKEVSTHRLTQYGCPLAGGGLATPHTVPVTRERQETQAPPKLLRVLEELKGEATPLS